MSSSIYQNNPPPSEDHPPGKLAVGVREEEVCRILNLKNSLDYSDVLIKYTGKYLSLGWQVVAVTSRGQANLGLDFRQPESRWARRLTELGLEGVQVNLGVRTGAVSRLLVLEVHKHNSVFPFNQPGDWCARCVAAVGREREQHYYAIPPNWRAPASHFLSAFQVMVFGEGGLVLAPPSVEPEIKANLHWLKPPWEYPPAPPGSILKKFLQTTSPPADTAAASPPPLPSWEELYPHIRGYPHLLQVLLAPACGGDYYHTLLEAALKAGLKDERLLLGLLWHAPQGELRHQPQGLATLRELVRQRLSQDNPEWWWDSEAEAAIVAAETDARRQNDPVAAAGAAPVTFPGQGAATPPGSNAPLTFGRKETSSLDLKETQEHLRQLFSELRQTWQEVWQFSQENLVVERRRYEAMIYELGRLGAWRDFGRRQHQENQLLRAKLESQWHRELNYLRRLLKENR